MSAYKKIKTEYRSYRALKAALEAVYGSGNVEISKTGNLWDNPLPLFDWHGKKRPERVAVAIRRKTINKSFSSGASNDIGYAYDPETKCFVEIVSDYDSVQPTLTQARKRTKQEYAYENIRAKARAKGLKVERKVVDGQIHVKVRR